MFTELNGSGDGRHPAGLKLAVFRVGCHKSNRQRCEVEKRKWSEVWCTRRDVCPPRKLSVASGEGRLGVGFEG